MKTILRFLYQVRSLDFLLRRLLILQLEEEVFVDVGQLVLHLDSFRSLFFHLGVDLLLQELVQSVRLSQRPKLFFSVSITSLLVKSIKVLNKTTMLMSLMRKLTIKTGRKMENRFALKQTSIEFIFVDLTAVKIVRNSFHESIILRYLNFIEQILRPSWLLINYVKYMIKLTWPFCKVWHPWKNRACKHAAVSFRSDVQGQDLRAHPWWWICSRRKRSSSRSPPSRPWYCPGMNTTFIRKMNNMEKLLDASYKDQIYLLERGKLFVPCSMSIKWIDWPFHHKKQEVDLLVLIHIRSTFPELRSNKVDFEGEYLYSIPKTAWMNC